MICRSFFYLNKMYLFVIQVSLKIYISLFYAKQS